MINFDIDDLSQLDEENESRANSVSQSRSSTSKADGKFYLISYKLVDLNRRSVVVRNLTDDTSIDELEKLFSQFGLVNKVTMLYDKSTKKSKG